MSTLIIITKMFLSPYIDTIRSIRYVNFIKHFDNFAGLQDTQVVVTCIEIAWQKALIFLHHAGGPGFNFRYLGKENMYRMGPLSYRK